MSLYSSASAAFLVLGLLSGCVPSGADCTREERRELRTVETLIAQTRADMARGYRQEESGGNGSVNVCLGGGGNNVGVSFCADPTRQSRTVAVDAATEERKLQALEARRLALLSGIRAKAATCAGTGAL